MDKAFLNLNSKKLIGKDVSINFNNMNLGNNNNPRLKSNSISVNDEKEINPSFFFSNDDIGNLLDE